MNTTCLLCQHLGNLTRKITKRDLAVSGQFYPNDESELNKYIDHFDKVLENSNIDISFDFTPRAIISPHAGYVYSGFTANIAYKYIPKTTKTIVVIGPSHKFKFDGASIAMYDSYPTPYGDLTIDTKLSQTLLNNFDFLIFDDKVHCEHSTETQMPLIKHYLPNTQIIEIVYGKCDYQDITKLITKVLTDKDNFIVISTDLSHFHNLKDANILDDICLNGILKKDINILNQGCEACGITGVKALVDFSSKNNFKTKFCDYRTSADVSNDNTKVVGYTSFIFGV